MIIFHPKPKRPRRRRAAQSGSGNNNNNNNNPAPPIRTQSAPQLPLRPALPAPTVPPDPPPYALYPPERTLPVTVAPIPTTQPRQNANASRVAVNSSHAGQDGPKPWQPKLPAALHHRISLCDLISNRLDAVITSIDGEVFSGDERELGA